MKLSLLFACAALTTPALAQNAQPIAPPIPVPTSNAKFDWKLRLAKGQTWTQTIQTVSRTGGSGFRRFPPVESTSTRTITLENEVLDVTSTATHVRTTFKNFDYTTKALPEKLFNSSYTPPSLLRALVGGSFTWKQSPDGRVSEVQGVKELIERQKNAVKVLVKTPAERTVLSSEAFKPDDLRNLLTQLQTTALPFAPLPTNGTYNYVKPFSRGQAGRLKIKRTLRSLAPQNAIFDENADFKSRSSTAISSGFTAREHPVILTRDAAQLFLMVNHRVSSRATPAYLSRNGRVYYRNAQNPTEVIWLNPPELGIYLTREEAAPYSQMRGYNNSKNGRTLPEAINQDNFDFDVARVDNPSSLNKSFTVIQGTVSGQTTVSPATGLISQSQVLIRLHGRTTDVDGRGRNTTPFWLSVQTTISTP